MITCSAPGKIFLFGEHSVVYGKAAIACAIDKRVSATLVPCSSVKIKIAGQYKPVNPKKNPYVAGAIYEMNKIAELPGFCIDINSELPSGAGLGSSSAVTVATIKSLDVLADTKLSLKEIAEMSHKIETNVQGKASPTDTFVSTFGGSVKIPEKVHIDFFDAKIVIGNTGKFASTTNLVSDVYELMSKHPDSVNCIMDAMDRVSRDGEIEIQKKDYKKIGELMNINQGLLNSIGVSTVQLENLIWAARNSGAYGAKLTGAGGGGCMIALCDENNIQKVVNAIKKAGGDPFVCNTTKEGVRVDKNNVNPE
ncbi:MAG: mevalonate kinase [Methanosarcinaceae archaeon]|nr:mevalonate kinase [Methanosarcinaceae archaeon]